MLKKISIINYAVIEKIEVEFDKGLCIITGETGAGKSILIDALELALGSRTETASIRDKEKKSIVEVSFDIRNNSRVSQWLEENNFDSDKELLLRREFSVNGKSRAFLNDTPVNLQQLKYLRLLLIDLHQQFEHAELTNSDYQRQMIDLISGCEKERKEYQVHYTLFKKLSSEIDSLLQKSKDEQKEMDYKKFLLDELNAASFKANEIEETASEIEILENSEEIAELINQFRLLLQEGDEAFLPRMKILLQKAQPYAGLSPELKEIEKRLKETYTELSDISQDLSKQEGRFHPDGGKKAYLNERLDLGYRLLKKHQVRTTAELLEIQTNLSQFVLNSENPEEIISKKSKQLSELNIKLQILADELCTCRKKEVPFLVQKINLLLGQVGMPKARFDILINKTEKLTPEGADHIEFVFNANIPAGELLEKINLRPIGEISSGGELSRLMLCLHSCIAEKTALPVLVFDEIDSGISGEAARQVGLLMKKMASTHQLIAITHMPQVAARADNHFFVYKGEEKNAITTKIQKLSAKEHVESIARMISGNEITESTLQIARELIERETNL